MEYIHFDNVDNNENSNDLIQDVTLHNFKKIPKQLHFQNHKHL